MTKRFNFTKASLEALEPPKPGKRSIWSDAKIRGLQIRVTDNGTKTFSVYRRVKGGAPVRVTLGQFPGMTIEQARRQASEAVAAIEGGANPAEIKRAHRAELTFAELFSEYMERHARPNKRTAGEDERQFRQYLQGSFANKKVSAIDRAAVAAIHHRITKEGHRTQANRVVALISSVFGRGKDWGLLTQNPAEGVARNKERSRDRFLLAGELPRFFSALVEEPNESMRHFFLLALLTGSRRSNLLEMRWEELSLEERAWHVPRTKNDTSQTVHLPEAAIQILQARRAASGDQGYVFPGPGKTGHLTPPKSGWRRLMKSSGLTKVRLHDLRRTLGSWQAMTGASLPIIGKSLNHKSPHTTALSARLVLDPVRLHVDRAAEAMLAAAGINKTKE